MQRDGSCPADDEACTEIDGSVVPFPRGRDVAISIVNDDGSETRLTNVKRVYLRARGRTEPVTVILELYSPIIDVVVPAVFEWDNEPETGDFLGEDRTHRA